MALIHGIAMLTLMLLFLLAVTGVGTWVLQTLRLSIDTKMQHALVSAALGVLAVEVVFSGIEYTQQIRKGALVIAALLLVFVVRGFKVMRTVLARGWQELANSRSKMLIVTAIAVVLTFEFLASQAPLTGSDALHYHFTTEKLVLQNGFGPQFSIVLSFFCGQHHLLILFGLALAGEQLAMAFIFLGGALAACSLGALAALWCPLRTALWFTLLFLLTPVVFWQISSAGAPDVWMAFFATAAVIVLCPKKATGLLQTAFVAGLLSGGIAGGKYTGFVLALAIAAAVALEYQSVGKTLLFGTGALATGMWPYLRNFLWTGDPVFPFLSRLLKPGQSICLRWMRFALMPECRIRGT